MASPRNVVVLVGSLRKDSINRKVAHALIKLAPPSLKPEIVEIGQLPLYNQDDDTNPPEEWTAFRERIRAADALLFVTPEYNRSVPCGPEERNRRRIASLRAERVVWKARSRRQRIAERDRRLRRQSSSAPIARIPQRPCDAAAGGLYRPSGQAL
jgi:hypothetical protein